MTLHSVTLFESHTWLAKCSYFNALLYLTSPLLTESESTIVTDNSTNKYSKGCHDRYTFILALVRLWWAASRSHHFTLCTYWKADLWPAQTPGGLKRRANFGQWDAWTVPDTKCSVVAFNKNASNLIRGETEWRRSPRCWRSNERVWV